ncbi:MAG: metal ABC transporter substrate-binding protein [Candidatus Diapherotrites archaeon]|nr:metal ABC transporter substrate-binding protein [Candidatus Diapherotrites archaeon]
MIKKILFLVVFFSCALFLAGCMQTSQVETSGKLKVVASFYPMYDFAKNVGGDRVEVTSLMPVGVEPHDFEPTPSDIKTLSSARVFILNGVIEDSWAPKLLEGIDNNNLTIVDASKGIQLVASQDADEPGNDPHIWLDPVNAKKQVANIRDALVKADPAGKNYYEANANTYLAELDALDANFRTTMATCKNKDIIITHATMAYFCKEYGCNQVAIEGVNAEGEPTPAVVAAIIEQAKDKNITAVFVEKLYNPQVAQTIAKEIGGKVAVFNTIHGLTLEEQHRGENYLSLMEENLEIIKESLECS